MSDDIPRVARTRRLSERVSVLEHNDDAFATISFNADKKLDDKIKAHDERLRNIENRHIALVNTMKRIVRVTFGSFLMIMSVVLMFDTPTPTYSPLSTASYWICGFMVLFIAAYLIIYGIGG